MWVSDMSATDDLYSFLGAVFDAETGLIKRDWVEYALCSLEVLNGGHDWNELLAKQLAEQNG